MWYPFRGHNSGPILIPPPGFSFVSKKKKKILCIPPLQYLLPWWLPGCLSFLYSGFGPFWLFQNKNEVLCLFFCLRSILWQIRVPAPWAPKAISTHTDLPPTRDSVCFWTAFLHPRFCHTNRDVQSILAQLPGSQCLVAFSVFFPRLWWVFGLSSVTLFVPPHIKTLCVNAPPKNSTYFWFPI